MKRYQLSEYFEKGRSEEGMRTEEVERFVADHQDSNVDTGQRRWRFVLPLVLALLLGCGSVIVAVQLGKGGYGDLLGEIVADEETVPDSLRSHTREEDRSPLMPDEPALDGSDAPTGIWGYRLKAGDRLRYERTTLSNDIDRKERKEYTEWADMTVERVGSDGAMTLHVAVTHGEEDTGMVFRAIISTMGEVLRADMIHNPSHQTFLEKTMRPSFGGGMQLVPSVAAIRELERWLPVWRESRTFGSQRRYSTREVSYDTGWSASAPDFDDASIHGDTIGSAVYYSSARSRGITDEGPERPITKKLRPGTSESSISMVPIITSGEDTAEPIRAVQFIDTTIETHHYVLLTPVGSPTGRIAWSDANTTVRLRSSTRTLNDTLTFRSSDGALLEWSSRGKSKGMRGLNTTWTRYVRLVGNRD